MAEMRNINTKLYNKNQGVNSPVLRGAVIIYLAMTFYEFAFSTTVGSVLKFYGLAIMGAWLILAIKDRIRVKINIISGLMILWLFANFLSLFWSRDFSTGFYYVYSTGNMICILFVVQNIYWTPESAKKMLILYAGSATLLALLIIVQGDLYHGVGIRYTLSMFGQEMDPNGLSAFLAPPALLLMHFFIQWKKKILSMLPFVVCVIAMMLVGSRGGLVSLLVGIAVYLTLSFLWDKDSLAKKWLGVILIVILGIIAIYFISNYVNSSLLERLFSFEDYTEDGGSDRVELWTMALEYLSQAPLFGLGIGSYFALTGRGIHNMYLSVLCDVGVFSFLPFISSFLYCIRNVWNKRQKLAVTLMACMMTYIFFLDTYQKKTMWNIFIIVAILGLCSETESNSVKNKGKGKSNQWMSKVRM